MVTITIKAIKPYNAYFGEGIIKKIPELLQRSLNLRQKPRPQVFVVTDKNVSQFYLRDLVGDLKKGGFKVGYKVFKPGEKLKSYQNIHKLLRLMIKQGLTRDSVVIGLGGGVIGDFSGFAASVYMRGCYFIQVPTTLLSQVDSSIGGKVGINLKEGKNLIGSFYSPLFVVIDTETLNTLHEREFVAGLSEVIKYGLIFDKMLFDRIKKFFEKNIAISSHEVKSLLQDDRKLLNELIVKSVKIKKDIVGKDEREKNLRMILNFGHTFGHALEKITSYRRLLHGEAVILGMKMAVELSHAYGILGEAQKGQALDVLNIFSIPSVKGVTARSIYNQIGRDKKRRGGKIHYILLKDIGNAVIETDINKRMIVESINKTLS